ncbi:Endospore coat-associated protein YheD [Bacillus sp. THAF10]|uniref:YheC/YheD family endospore coat-associated protein n=1 Tax=Bacillus sp. THAF10 TaxID=2587848 RepID=UPI0012680BDA|nr:YheC/YheD family protein [Bacillus sp. THAF10]QFT88239.1 Endospore coat-associated protein YheD [Bacillus sp. THAF10]
MIELHYEPSSRSWYQMFDDVNMVMLGKHYAVPYRAVHTKKHISFSFLANDRKAGPLIGILASPKNKGFIGNIPLFKRIQVALQKKGGLSVVFTPDQLTEDGLRGYCYLPKEDQWVKIHTPIPDIIYNRLSRYRDEKLLIDETEKITSIYSIPIINPGFFDKWELYLQLKDNDQLLPHLPKTTLLSVEGLEEYLALYPSVYIKKRRSHKGKGVYLITRNGDALLMKTTSTTTVLFPSIQKLILYFYKKSGVKDYIIQEAIPTLGMKGKKFDYRILAHASKKRFTVTGVGVRMAKKQQVTTHVPAGGVVISTEDLPMKTDQEIIEKLVSQCGKQLIAFYDDIGEFSADVGVTPDGKYYIFELNAKPMDFDEAPIKKHAAERITRVFYERTNFFLQENST